MARGLDFEIMPSPAMEAARAVHDRGIGDTDKATG